MTAIAQQNLSARLALAAPDQQTTLIDLFSGAGGSSTGYETAGLTVTDAFEIQREAVATYRANHLNTTVHQVDVQEVDFRRWNGVDIVAGSPPCQPFSVAGNQQGEEDVRDMTPEFVRAVSEASPRAFIMENVPGLTTPRHSEYFREMIEQLKAAGSGYQVKWSVLNAADYGVPQRRERLIVVGFRADQGVSGYAFPAATHGPGTVCSYNTVAQALATLNGDIGPLNQAIVTYAHTPVMRNSPWAGMMVNGGGRPLNPAAPSHTIPASAGGNRTHILDLEGVLEAYHAELTEAAAAGKLQAAIRTGLVPGVRRLTPRESAALQAFPQGYEFFGARSSVYRQIGNAVPPGLAAAVAGSVSRVLHGEATQQAWQAPLFG